MAVIDGMNFNQVKNEWKEIVHGNPNLEALYAGIKQMADVVAGTMGARGRTVIIHDAKHNKSDSTKDGVTVANAVHLKSDIENIGANMVKEVAKRVVKEAGDGTTTCMVLTSAILGKGIELLNQGIQPFEILKALDYIQDKLRNNLKEYKREIENTDEIYNIARIASNNDKEIADLVFEAITNTTEDTVINIEKSNTYESKVVMTDGYSFDRGYFNENFKDPNRIYQEYNNPLIFLTCEELIGRYDVEQIMTISQEENRPLVIICKDLLQDAYNLIVMNKLRMAFPVLVIKAPRFGIEQQNALDDIAVYTGAKVFGRQDGYAMGEVTLEDLGGCSSIKCGSDYTHIFEGFSEPKSLESRIQGLRYKLEDTIDRDKNDHFITDIKERISKLEGGICTIEVGANTEIERNEKYDRVEDALLATTSALTSGYISGGGAFYYHTANNMIKSNDTEDIIKILSLALYEPIRVILNNAFIFSDNNVIAELNKMVIASYSEAIPMKYGIDVTTGKVVNNYEVGIIDSAKIPETIIETVFSFCKTFLTTHATIIHKVEYFNNIQ